MNVKRGRKKLKFVIPILLSIGILSGFSTAGNAKTIGKGKTHQNSPIAVVIEQKELSIINLKNNAAVKLDSDGVFYHPLISPDRTYIGYIKDKSLYVTNTSGQKTKVADNIDMQCYTWLDKNRLMYSPSTGGIYVFDASKNEKKTLIENQYNYQNITIGTKRSVYAEKYLISGDSRLDYGVVQIDTNTKQENLVIKSIPSNADQTDLGMYPIIAGASKDLRYLFIYEHPHAGSLAADGVYFASYDTKLKKYVSYKDKGVFALHYKDNISASAANKGNIAFINGGNREMNAGKDLGVLNLANGSFTKLLPEDETAMTPSFSENGRTILYAASKESQGSEGVDVWMNKGNHFIYSIDVKTKKVTQLTKDAATFDFSPMYISSNSFVFFRRDLKDNISMWKYEKGKETKIADNLLFSDDYEYTMSNYYGHFYTTNGVDIK